MLKVNISTSSPFYLCYARAIEYKGGAWCESVVHAIPHFWWSSRHFPTCKASNNLSEISATYDWWQFAVLHISQSYVLLNVYGCQEQCRNKVSRNWRELSFVGYSYYKEHSIRWRNLTRSSCKYAFCAAWVHSFSPPSMSMNPNSSLKIKNITSKYNTKKCRTCPSPAAHIGSHSAFQLAIPCIFCGIVIVGNPFIAKLSSISLPGHKPPHVLAVEWWFGPDYAKDVDEIQSGCHMGCNSWSQESRKVCNKLQPTTALIVNPTPLRQCSQLYANLRNPLAAFHTVLWNITLRPAKWDQPQHPCHVGCNTTMNDGKGIMITTMTRPTSNSLSGKYHFSGGYQNTGKRKWCMLLSFVPPLSWNQLSVFLDTSACCCSSALWTMLWRWVCPMWPPFLRLLPIQQVMPLTQVLFSCHWPYSIPFVCLSCCYIS